MSLALSGLFVLTSFLVSGNPAVFIKTRGFPSLPHDRFGFIGIYSIYSAIAFNKMSVRSGVLKWNFSTLSRQAVLNPFYKTGISALRIMFMLKALDVKKMFAACEKTLRSIFALLL
jgi:hypothetical protein